MEQLNISIADFNALVASRKGDLTLVRMNEKYMAIELKRNMDDHLYFVLENFIDHDMALCIYREEDRNIPFDLSGPNFSMKVTNLEEMKGFIDESISIIVAL